MQSVKKAGYFDISLEREMDSSFKQHSPSVIKTIRRKPIPPQPHIEPSVYQYFFEHSSDAMLIADADCKILRVNAAFEAITGYAADEVIGQIPHVLSPGAHNDAFYDQLWESLNRKGYWRAS